jgi:hypothetical protein
MAAEIKKEIQLKIAHVLSTDIVGFSKLSVNEQHARVQELNEIAWTGEKDLGLEQLSVAVRIPGHLSYDDLRLHPYRDPLREDPHFEKIVASLAPKEASK